MDDSEILGAAALVVNDGGEYLLHLRDDVPGVVNRGTWSLLGGTRDPDDVTLEATIVRELGEEAGLVVPGLRRFVLAHHTWEGARGSIQVFWGRWNGSAQALRLTEGVMLRWFPGEMVHRLRMCPWAEDVIRQHEKSVGGKVTGHATTALRGG
ncbi:NUDIX domain-containing protein [Streptomyces sp. SM12]|uniref:NUDIX domain-containing protein n=1 Tax=Streptomyces sp. SM12 TaxID=1071602 RepID=UPI000CD54669|nr:NUDIX domain-containing protein [Streptomyces sp. SM12]